MECRICKKDVDNDKIKELWIEGVTLYLCKKCYKKQLEDLNTDHNEDGLRSQPYYKIIKG